MIGSTFLDGVLHPWFGIDHLMLVLAIGLLAAAIEKGSLIAVPIVFLCSLMAGAGLHGSGIVLPLVDLAIAVSVILFGAVLLSTYKLPEIVIAIAVALSGMFLGYSYGMSIPAASLPVSYLIGLAFGSILLLAVSIWLGHWIDQESPISRGLGGVILLCGLILFAIALVT